MDAILIVIEAEHDCEYFCRNCGQLRLWLKGVKVTNCTACSSANIVTGEINSTELTAMRENWRIDVQAK
jgi:hypothetical protein